MSDSQEIYQEAKELHSNKEVTECDMLLLNSEKGNSSVCQLLGTLIHRVSGLEDSLHLLQKRVELSVGDIHQMKKRLESLSQKHLTESEMEETLQSITKTFEQKLEQYISESQTKETCFEQKYSDIISLHETQISEIKSSVQQLEDKLEQWMENKTDHHNQPIKIPDTIESLRSKLDNLVDSLVPKKVSMKRHTQLREDRNERRSSFNKKPRPKSELLFSETPVKIPRSSSVSSNTSVSSVTSGYKSLHHQESGEISLPPDLSPITEVTCSILPGDVTDPGASSGNSPSIPLHSMSTPSFENDEEVPDHAHIILEVAWSMGDLLDLLNTLSSSFSQQDKDVAVEEK